MSASLETNLDEVNEALEAALPSADHELVVANVMEYARYLNDRKAYFVLNDGQLKRIVREKLRSLDELSDEKIEAALDTAATEYVNWLTDFSGEVQPPLTRSEAQRAGVPGEAGDPRDARQGSWADRTGNLAAGYRTRVNDNPVRDHDDVAPEPTKALPEQTNDFPE